MEESVNNEVLLHRFLNRETSELENNEILQWVSSSEENRANFRKAHQLHHLSNLNGYRAGIDVDRAWDKLYLQLPKVKSKPKHAYLSMVAKVAASIIILLAVGFGSIWTNEHFFTNIKSAIVQFEAPKGEKSKVVLADGSQVWLNSETILKYDARNPREITMIGEAFFEVHKDRAHPFEITTASGLKVKVLGTKFNLRSLADESFVETTLDEGEVVILNKESEQLALLKPGQQAKYDLHERTMQVENVSTEVYSIWRNNELRFTDIAFTELVSRIERWYGVSIDLDPLIGQNDRFTMTIKTESLRELLTMMQLTSKFKYEINGAQIKIRAK